MASITKLPSGRYRALVRKTGHKTKSATFAKRADAKRWADELERQIDSVRVHGSIDVAKGLFFSDFIDAYVKATDPIKPHGKNKKATLSRLKKEFKGVAMVDMSEPLIRDFIARRMKEKTQVGKSVSGVTIGIDLSYITTVLTWAREVKSYNVDTEMATRARSAIRAAGLSTKAKEREREASDAELEMIFDEYERRLRQEIPMIDIIKFALATSMRQEEICSIRIEDIDFDRKTVIIRDRKDPKEKIGNDQVVPLLPRAWELAIKHKGDRKQGRVFNYKHRSVSSSFTRVCQKLGIEDLRFHDLRHTAIGDLFAAGLQIQQVALLSGHKDWKTLRRYTHIKAHDVHKAFERLSASINS